MDRCKRRAGLLFTSICLPLIGACSEQCEAGRYHYNKTQSDDFEYFGRLALAMKGQEEEDIHIHTYIHTTPYEAKARLCSRKLGQGARCKCSNCGSNINPLFNKHLRFLLLQEG